VHGVASRLHSEPPMRRRRRRSGFLLIEVLISLLLLTVAGAGALALLGTVVSSTQFSGQAQTAMRLGQDLLDRVMQEPFATIGTTGSACVLTEPEQITANGLRLTIAQAGPGNMVPYTRSCQVITIGTGVGAGLKVIRVRVVFQDGTGTTRTIRLGGQRAS
jgi:type II secretory pathway pseudopilin PulG